MPSGYRFHWADTHKWPHTKTLHLTKDDLKKMRSWLAANTNQQYRVVINPTKRAKTEGIYSVIVYLNDPDAWIWFRLTWC
jgi:hypothetical protein